MPFASRLRRGLGLACAGLALAAPAAHAQGAGDDQYADPFGGEQATPTATPRPRAAATPQPTAAPAAGPAATATPAAPAGPAAAPGPTLPYTGIDAWVPGLSGLLLLGTGAALRLRLREPD